MRQIYALMAAALLAGVPAAGMAMDSQTLLSDPARYRVLSASDDEVVYADMTTLRGQQTLDYPGSIENMHVTLYVESYKEHPDAFDFARNTLVSGIREFHVKIHADKRDGQYAMKKELTAFYDSKGGKKTPDSFLKAYRLDADAEELYLPLSRLERLRSLSGPANF